MKREYVKPMMNGERFVANEYVAACWKGECNISGYVYLDTNGNGVYDEGVDKYSYRNTACQAPCEFTGVDNGISSASDLHNAFVVGKHTKYVYNPDKWWGQGGYDAIEVTETTNVFNWDDHVATIDSISRHEKPNHS